ncbi:hypothetical protein WISP_12779 [Willisornis vidua]|uniref:Uncharacterized protein n=1 Tax=Willisornis vidua TaxID=1566151 RepID=A0ABQ9DQU8_9PASS|nr:hypothetical protein WISP_12779 [Willisornis vidua]
MLRSQKMLPLLENIVEYLINGILALRREGILPCAELLFEGTTASGLAVAVVCTIQDCPDSSVQANMPQLPGHGVCWSWTGGFVLLVLGSLVL